MGPADRHLPDDRPPPRSASDPGPRKSIRNLAKRADLGPLTATLPKDNDSDDDGILDGIERGWCQDSPLDSDSTINALDNESDGDGILDGVEDANKNGIVDIGETDGLDADGFLDWEEVLTDASFSPARKGLAVGPTRKVKGTK